jgi:hydrogenase/urease accessory protein HupE
LLVAAPALADEFRPAYLQLTQIDDQTYDVLWKVPALDESTTLGVRPEFPAGAEGLTEERRTYAAGTAVVRWRMRVPGGLEGKPITFSNLSLARIDVLARLQRLDGSEQLQRILPHDPRFVAVASPGPLEVVRTYTVLGVEHILGGIDHLLFVLALVLLVDDRRRLVLTITAFTLAHSLTLAGATLGLVHVPGPPVEAAIALSIVFVAVEILHRSQGGASTTARYPWIVAFGFGLLHGFGFAGALAEVGLPPAAIPIALLFFNVGVEIGQLLFVVAIVAVGKLLTRLARHLEVLRRQWVVRVPPYLIGGLASFWVVQRVAAF